MHYAMRDVVTYWNVEMLSIYPGPSSREPVTSNVMSS